MCRNVKLLYLAVVNAVEQEDMQLATSHNGKLRCKFEDMTTRIYKSCEYGNDEGTTMLTMLRYLQTTDIVKSRFHKKR